MASLTESKPVQSTGYTPTLDTTATTEHSGSALAPAEKTKTSDVAPVNMSDTKEKLPHNTVPEPTVEQDTVPARNETELPGGEDSAIDEAVKQNASEEASLPEQINQESDTYNRELMNGNTKSEGILPKEPTNGEEHATPAEATSKFEEEKSTEIEGVPHENEAVESDLPGPMAANGDSHLNGNATKPITNGNGHFSNGNGHLSNGSAETTKTNGQDVEVDEISDDEPKCPTGPVYQPTEDPGPTRFASNMHPLADMVIAETNAYFLDNWPFRTERAKQHFIAADSNRWACLCFSMALDDRMADAANVNTLLFLLDDIAEDMSVDEGKAFYKKLIAIARGELEPNNDDAVERVTNETWQKLRTKDLKLANDVLDGAILCLRAQVDERRLKCTNLKKLLEFRGEEGGVLFVSNLMCWSMGLHLPKSDFDSLVATKLFRSYSDVAMVVNDILSFDKELRAWETGHKEGAQLLNIIEMLSEQTGLSYAAAKRIAWVMVREWELNHLRLVDERLAAPGGCSEELKTYLKGWEYLLAGNEIWSWSTGRYHKLE